MIDDVHLFVSKLGFCTTNQSLHNLYHISTYTALLIFIAHMNTYIEKIIHFLFDFQPMP